jgi:hypothetical protein
MRRIRALDVENIPIMTLWGLLRKDTAAMTYCRDLWLKGAFWFRECLDWFSPLTMSVLSNHWF